MLLVISSLGRGHTRIPTIRTGSVLRNQACAGPVCAWFKNNLAIICPLIAGHKSLSIKLLAP